MPFSYYRRLNRFRKRVYRNSDRVGSVSLPGAPAFLPRVQSLMEVLSLGDRRRTEEEAQALVTDIARVLGVYPAKVSVLERRPAKRTGELHGLYERNPEWRYPRITVWMRTAEREHVVAPKTFLRTLLHEVTHHLDYTWLKLGDSLHTQGFYRRESSLLKQLYP